MTRLSADRRIPPLAAGLLALAGFAVSLGAGGPERLRFTATAGGLFFSAGYAALRMLRRGSREEGEGTLALAFPVSCVILFLPLFAGQLFGVGTKILDLAARPILLGSGLILVAEGARARVRSRFPLWVAAAVVAVGALALFHGSLITAASDAPDHIAVIREIQATGDCFPLGAYYGEPTDQLLDARKGFHYPAAAVAGSLARVDAPGVFDALPGVAAALFAIAFWALAREVLGGGAAPALALAFALLSFDGGVFGVWFGRSPSAFGFAAPVVWSGLAFLLRAARGLRPARAALLLHGFTLMGIHVFSAVTVLFLGGLFLVALPWMRREEREFSARRTVFGLGLLAAGAAPIGLWRFLTGYPALDPIHSHLQAVVWVGRGLYFSNPLRAFSRISLFGFAAVPLSLLLLREARRSVGLLFAVAITLLPILVTSNPILVPLLTPFIGYLVGRIVWFGGYDLVLGYLFARWARTAVRPASWGRRTASGAALLFLALLFAGSLRSADASGLQQRLRFRPVHNEEREEGPELWSDLFAWMTANLPPRAVIATDPLTGYLIPAYTPQKALAVKAQHSSPGDPTAPERLRDAIRVTSPYFGGEETLRALDRWNADYVLLNFRFPGLRTTYLGSVDPVFYEPALRKFRSEPDRYREVYARDRCHLFRIDRSTGALPFAGPVLNARLDAAPVEAKKVDRLFPNDVRLLAASVDRESTALGDSVRVACYWRKEGETDDPLPYKIYLRMDRVSKEGEGNMKPARLWEQIRTGTHDRTRIMRNPGSGAYPIFSWSVGEIVADTIRARVPGNLRGGRYELQVLLRRAPFIQVYEIGDLLRERDSFSGVPVGELTLTRRERAAAAPAAPPSDRSSAKSENAGERIAAHAPGHRCTEAAAASSSHEEIHRCPFPSSI
ncbi:MAG: hypothetical protein JW958_06800 [Candidatus Eisenbacteria bacterium]|nr:hypothetical protein [Candidatus Eisenbacteria bacterium]